MSREDETQDEPPLAFEDVWPDDKPFPLTQNDLILEAVQRFLDAEGF